MDERFDIDLAVEGIERTRFFKACGAAVPMVTRDIDLIDLDDASELLRARIAEDGIDLL